MPGYKFTEPSELKSIILFIIHGYGEPIDNSTITDIFMYHEFVDYFTMQQYLNELTSSGLLETFSGNSTNKYIITASGLEAYNGFSTHIPISVRENILRTIKDYKKKLADGRNITAKYIYHNEIDHEANLKITEGTSVLMELSLNAGSKENARLICENFKNNPQKIYSDIFNILTLGHSEKDN